MQKISKTQNYFRRNYFYLMGGFWLFAGIFIGLVAQTSFMSTSYLVFGSIFLIAGYFSKANVSEFISWDDEKIEIREWLQSPKIYKRENIDEIRFTDTNFIIKSGPAGGTMVELKGYNKTDLELLRREIEEIPVQILS